MSHAPQRLAAPDGTTVEKSRVIDLFEIALPNLADDYLEDGTRSEYNAVKHGLRLMPGGNQLTIHPVGADGNPDPNAEPIVIGSGEAGAAVFDVVQDAKRKWHLRVSMRMKNWDISQTLKRLQIAGAWMACVKDSLRISLYDTDPPPRWDWSRVLADCEVAWKPTTRIRNASLNFGDFAIPADVSKEWVLASYDSQPT